jgi:hypothetical protein
VQRVDDFTGPHRRTGIDQPRNLAGMKLRRFLVAALAARMGQNCICDQHFGCALEQSGVLQRFSCAIDGTVDTTSLAIEHGSPGEYIGETMFRVGDSQVR